MVNINCIYDNTRWKKISNPPERKYDGLITVQEVN